MAEGFVRPTTVYKLVFDDPKYAGLEVRARSTSIGRMLQMAEWATAGRAVTGIDEVAKLIDAFAEVLESWNLLEVDGVTPVPATAEGLRAQEPAFVLDIVGEWMSATGGDPKGPLEQPSTGGGPPLEVLLPMEVLSPNHSSLPVPS